MNNKHGFAAVALDNVKFNVNLGHVLRAATCYETAMVVASGRRYSPTCVDTTRYYKHAPLLCVNDVFDAIPYDCIPIAVELHEESRPINNLVTDRDWETF